ncbi:MAG: cobalamin-binding protein [Gammaproteobacteria bacterium]|nr:MAG: cobalamin-binding protein [Gammaproteobacteria bacterium]
MNPFLLCIRLAGVLALLIPVSLYADAVTVRDDTGHEITLPAPARRIISLAPHITEMIFRAGAGKYLIAVVDHSDFPAAAKALPRVGGHNRIDLETIVTLEPDLIIGWQGGNRNSELERIRDLGLVLYLTEPRQLDDIPRHIENIGRLAGTPIQANNAADSYRNSLTRLERSYKPEELVATFYQIWHQPLMTVNARHMIGQVIEFCGGRNVYADLAVEVPTVSTESVLEADPELIIAGGSAGSRDDWFAQWKQWPAMQAVAGGNMVFINPDIVQRQGPRITQGVKEICEIMERVRNKR